MNSTNSPMRGISRTLRDAFNASVSPTLPIAATFTALALLTFLVPLAPPAQAVTCEPGQSGILNGTNFSRGTSARHNDYRVVCRGDSSGRRVTRDDINGAIGHRNADRFADDSVDQVVLQFNNAYLDWGDNELDGNLVLLGTVRGDSGRHGINISTYGTGCPSGTI